MSKRIDQLPQYRVINNRANILCAPARLKAVFEYMLSLCSHDRACDRLLSRFETALCLALDKGPGDIDAISAITCGYEVWSIIVAACMMSDLVTGSSPEASCAPDPHSNPLVFHIDKLRSHMGLDRLDGWLLQVYALLYRLANVSREPSALRPSSSSPSPLSMIDYMLSIVTDSMLLSSKRLTTVGHVRSFGRCACACVYVDVRTFVCVFILVPFSSRLLSFVVPCQQLGTYHFGTVAFTLVSCNGSPCVDAFRMHAHSPSFFFFLLSFFFLFFFFFVFFFFFFVFFFIPLFFIQL